MLLLASASLPAEVLRLAGNVWPPYTDRSLPGEGLSVELIRTALGRGGYQVEYIEVPWERALLGLRNGSYDMINGWRRLHAQLTPVSEQPDALGPASREQFPLRRARQLGWPSHRAEPGLHVQR